MRHALMIALALALLAAAPAAAQGLTFGDLEPDAALLAQTGAGETIDGAAWSVATVYGHRAWVDLIDVREDWGIGASADLSPGGAACAGVGYRGGVIVYYGLHF